MEKLKKIDWDVFISYPPNEKNNRILVGRYVGLMELEQRLNIISMDDNGKLIPMWCEDVILKKHRPMKED